MNPKPNHSRKRTPRSSIAPPVHPKHRSLLNEEAEALQRFWNSQRTLPDLRTKVEPHLYSRSKSTPNSAPGTPMLWSQIDDLKVAKAKRLLQLLKLDRPTRHDDFPPPRASIPAPMRRIGPRLFLQWTEEVPESFGPTAKSVDCGYYGKEYKVLQLKDALEILVLKNSLRL